MRERNIGSSDAERASEHACMHALWSARLPSCIRLLIHMRERMVVSLHSMSQ